MASEHPNLTPAQHEVRTAEYLLRTDHPFGITPRRLAAKASFLMTFNPDDTLNAEAIKKIHPHASDESMRTFIAGYFEHIATLDTEPDELEIFEKKSAAVELYNREFAQIVNELNREEHELATGFFSDAYSIIKDGVQYVVRVIRPVNGMQQVEKHINAALRVPKIPQLEQVVAISYVDGITVAPLLPGRTLLYPKEAGVLKHVTSEQIQDIYNVMKQANANDVGIDGNGANILYDKEIGFSIIDLEPLEPWATACSATLDQLSKMAAFPPNDIEYLREMERIIGVFTQLVRDDPDSGVNTQDVESLAQGMAQKIQRLRNHSIGTL